MGAGDMSQKLARLGGIDIPKIRYFLAATEHLNYARAALALGVSSSTLSRQIHRLEDSLGVSLFERHRNGIRLTVAGRQFHARAQQVIFELGRAIDNAARAGRAEIGDLYLGVAPSILMGPLQGFLATLTDTALMAHDLVLPPLMPAERERYYADSRRFGTLFGIPETAMLRDWAGFSAYVDTMLSSDTLSVTPAARQIADALLGGAGLPCPLPRWYRALTARMLPSRFREDLGLPYGEAERSSAETSASRDPTDLSVAARRS